MDITTSILNLALQLTEKDRAMLAHELLLSLEPDMQMDEEYEANWKAEIEARMESLERDPNNTRDAFEVIEEIRQCLAERRAS